MNPPDKYRVRYTDYMLKKAFTSIPNSEVSSPNVQDTKKQWRVAMHKALRQQNTA